MFARALVLIVGFTAIAVALLALRQERFETMHQMAVLHRQINTSRQQLWHWQSRIAERTEPRTLRAALVRAKLEMDPATAEQPKTTVVRLNR